MSEVEAGQAADDGRASDQTRRRFLTAATSGISAVGVVGVAVPFMASWNPSEKAKAAGAPVKADISKIEPGQMVVVEWRGKPVYVLRRTPEQIAGLPSLGCAPKFRPEVGAADLGGDSWLGGFFCPCHGSKFDLAGRVYKGVPAADNLIIPPYSFEGDNVLVIGVDTEVA
jgi:ubiquinol-cytochrome c reductase iron-sulfur subunit